MAGKHVEQKGFDNRIKELKPKKEGTDSKSRPTECKTRPRQKIWERSLKKFGEIKKFGESAGPDRTAQATDTLLCINQVHNLHRG